MISTVNTVTSAMCKRTTVCICWYCMYCVKYTVCIVYCGLWKCQQGRQWSWTRSPSCIFGTEALIRTHCLDSGTCRSAQVNSDKYSVQLLDFGLVLSAGVRRSNPREMPRIGESWHALYVKLYSVGFIRRCTPMS